jgi:M6 family metalloprotease-like protein
LSAGLAAVLLGVVSGTLLGLQPPTQDQVREYTANGTLAQHNQAAQRRGNHRTNPRLVSNLRRKLLKTRGKSEAQITAVVGYAPPPAWQGGLPAKGEPKVLVMLVDFPDYPRGADQTVADVAGKFFGNGDPGQMPYESLRNFYQRSSYSQLTIGGNVLGWYQALHNRSYYAGLGDGPGQEELMMEAINYFDVQGHDFAQYDNDNNGAIDAVFIKWTGPDNGWADFWWAYQADWQSNPNYTVDGKHLGKYVWSWISNPAGGVYQPRVDIHETGHLLGLPDLYDYNSGVGPPGGVGGLDMMDTDWGDHNCFSKLMLEWLTPTIISDGSQTIALNPSGTSTDCVLIMPDAVPGETFDEFFMAQYRKRSVGDDPADYPADGFVVWHIDSTLNESGTDFLYDNSYTAHKLVRLMEADGLEEIEQDMRADAGDFYVPPKTLGISTTPNSRGYAGAMSGVQIDQLSPPGDSMSGQFAVVAHPVITPASSTLTAESCGQGNGAIDPDETVTVSLSLRNMGSASPTNLVGTLQPTGGVTTPSGPQSYGVLSPGDPPVARPFTFTAAGNCGTALTITLQLQDAITDLGTATFFYTLGASEVFVESFDSVAAPSLPSGWTATVAIGITSPWVTTAASSDTPPNSVFASDASTVTDNHLESPSIAIPSSGGQLAFRHSYNLESGYDGGVLEIAVGAGGFTDITSAGGGFVSGGYVGTVSTCCGNPLSNRQAWTGDSGGLITTIVNLPAAAAGQSIRLRWRLATDNSYGHGGWYMDTVSITGPYICCPFIYPAPTVTSITPSAGANTNTVSIADLAGAGFQNGATVRLTRPGQVDIDGTGVSVVSPAQITCSFDLVGKALGQWTVVVTNPDGQSGTLPDGFAVALPPPTEVEATPSALCAGQCAALAATPGPGGDAVEWFTGSCGGTSVPDPGHICPLTTTTYYARTKNTATGDVSADCTQITVTVDHPPPMPIYPTPADGATGVPLAVQLQWPGYCEHFDSGDPPLGWMETPDSLWAVVSGEYRVQTGASTTWMQSAYAGGTWTDGLIQARIRRTGDPGPLALLLVRASDDLSLSGITGSAYAVGITGDGWFVVLKWEPSAGIGWLQDWTASPDLNTGSASNLVAVNFQGPSITVYFNGQLAWSGTDDSITGPGRIGLAAYSAAGYVTADYFDDVCVSDPLPAGLAAASSGPAACAVTCDVYLGTTNPPTSRICGDLSTTTCSPGPGGLLGLTTYYWQIVSKNCCGQAPGPVWSFRTASASPDFDHDGDVDQADFGHLQMCLSGPGIDQTRPECQDARLDGDSDVDDAEVTLFLRCLSGPDVPAHLDCAD